VVGVVLTLMFYLTPVFYGLRSVPEEFRWLLHLNPLTTLLEAYRAVLLGDPWPGAARLVTVAVIAVRWRPSAPTSSAASRSASRTTCDGRRHPLRRRLEGLPALGPGPTLRGLVSRRRKGRAQGRAWALRAVSFEIEPGEFVGLIGANGAGKSTLLRLASGVSSPTRGTAAVPPDTASVLSLGYSFDGALTGHENAHTSALLAGMSPSEVRRAVPDIMGFAELEASADSPLRTYSDGMKMRLAFGVVANLRPTALLLDEVLAVGDLRFQTKCLNRIDELRNAGTSVLFASHDLHQVADNCDRAVWLQRGEVRAYGAAAQIVEEYRNATHVETRGRTPAAEDAPGPDGLQLGVNRLGSQEAAIVDVAVGRAAGSTAEIAPGEPLELSFTIRPDGRRIESPVLSLTIKRRADDLIVFDVNTEAEGVLVDDLTQDTRVRVRFPRPRVAAGRIRRRHRRLRARVGLCLRLSRGRVPAHRAREDDVDRRRDAPAHLGARRRRMTVLSVIIPTRDRCGMLMDALDPVLGDAGVGEVVVVDDGSTDGTREALRAAAAADPRVVPHHLPGGGTGARPPARCPAGVGRLLLFLEGRRARDAGAGDAPPRSPRTPGRPPARGLHAPSSCRPRRSPVTPPSASTPASTSACAAAGSAIPTSCF
jgi:lipopolysaccharide transport system ATP-binding protein